jgi:hypothetical protein
MATTSGTINTVSFTRDEIILDALQDLRVVDRTVTALTLDPTDVTDCSRKLNMLLKRWEVKGFFLWLADTIQIPMITGKFIYTIGPGGDVNTYRPLRAREGSFIRQTCSPTTNIDIQLILLSRLEYEQYSNKRAQGIPNSFYYDPQMAPGPLTAYDPTLSKGVLDIWTAPVDMTRTIFLEVQRPVQDITDSTQTFDLPLEWYECLTKGLGAAVADKYEIPEQRLMRLKAEAKEALEYITDWGAQEQAPTYFQPDYQFGMYSGGKS